MFLLMLQALGIAVFHFMKTKITHVSMLYSLWDMRRGEDVMFLRRT
jgi:hypothetical protein